MKVKVMVTTMDGILLEDVEVEPFKQKVDNENQLAREIISYLGFKFNVKED